MYAHTQTYIIHACVCRIPGACCNVSSGGMLPVVLKNTPPNGYPDVKEHTRVFKLPGSKQFLERLNVTDSHVLSMMCMSQAERWKHAFKALTASDFGFPELQKRCQAIASGITSVPARVAGTPPAPSSNAARPRKEDDETASVPARVAGTPPAPSSNAARPRKEDDETASVPAGVAGTPPTPSSKHAARKEDPFKPGHLVRVHYNRVTWLDAIVQKVSKKDNELVVRINQDERVHSGALYTIPDRYDERHIRRKGSNLKNGNTHTYLLTFVCSFEPLHTHTHTGHSLRSKRSRSVYSKVMEMSYKRPKTKTQV